MAGSKVGYQASGPLPQGINTSFFPLFFTALSVREHCTSGVTMARGKFAIMSYYELWQQNSFPRQSFALRELFSDAIARYWS